MLSEKVFMSGYTDGYDPTPSTGKGALFEKFPFAHYWVKAEWNQTQNLKGTAQIWVPRGKRTILEVAVAP